MPGTPLCVVPHPCEGGSATGSEAGPGRTADVDDAYQVFGDGKLMGSFGDFSEKRQ